MSFRSALVDDFRANANIIALTGQRIFDEFYEFEDLLNQKANMVGNFPAITIESTAWEQENNLGGHDQLIHDVLSITLYSQVNTQKMSSRSASVRAAQRQIIQDLDTLNDIVVNYINDKKGVLGSYYMRSPHISSVSDGLFETEGNRKIVTKEITFNITYS
jgi:hypothetical protein